MTTQLLITTFDRLQTEFVLRNHEKFSKDEVTVAAKRMVELDKQLAFQQKMAGKIMMLERENAINRYNADMRGQFYRDEGYKDGLFKSLFGFAL